MVALDLGKTLVCSSDLFLRLAVSDLSLLLAVSFPHLITMAKIESIRCSRESDRKRIRLISALDNDGKDRMIRCSRESDQSGGHRNWSH